MFKRRRCYLRAPFRFFFSPLVLTADLLMRSTNSSTVSTFFSCLGLDLTMINFSLYSLLRNGGMQLPNNVPQAFLILLERTYWWFSNIIHQSDHSNLPESPQGVGA